MATIAENETVCQCEAHGNPLCGFCDDDLYCPQCGEPVTSISSRQSQGAEGRIWLYPIRTAGSNVDEFTFSLELSHRGADRQVARSCPVVQLDQCTVDAATWFERKLIEAPRRGDETSRLLMLKPLADRTKPGDHWHAQLPKNGLSAALTVAGNFGQKQFGALICRKPDFKISLDGPGILTADEFDPNSWQLWQTTEEDSKLAWTLTLTIEATKAPVHVNEPFCLTSDGTFVAQFLSEVPVGFDLFPDYPVELQVRFECRNWEIGASKTLNLLIPMGWLGKHTSEITLTRVALGHLKFMVDREPLDVGPRHFGEVIHGSEQPWGPLRVINEGQADLWLGPPQILPDPSPAGAEWIRAAWVIAPDDPDGPAQPVRLGPGDQRDIELMIDLSRLTPNQLPSGASLQAALCIVDEHERPWKLRIIVPRIVVPPKCEHFLAIDFGTTNTFAAIWNPKGTAAARNQVTPLLEPDEWHSFPTEIFFHDVSDEEKPHFVVGPTATLYGQACPSAKVSGLKRWIGVPDKDGHPRTFPVQDRQGNVALYEVSKLVRFVLQDIIQRVERSLRQKIIRIGLSFPSNFGTRRVRALRKIIDELSETRKAANPDDGLEVAELRIDEANAVAIGFVLDSHNVRNSIAPLMSPTRRSIVVGSFDFGGGTIDTALIRVHFDGEDDLEFAPLRSDYLGIGGNEKMGGDNVTIAVLELLELRLREQLIRAADDTSSSSIRLPLGRTEDRATAHAKRNFDALWCMAEAIKKFQCLGQPTPNERTLLIEKLNVELARLMGEFGPQGQAQERSLMQDVAVGPLLSSALEEGQFLIELDEVYQHEVLRDLSNEGGYTIRQRIEGCIDELADFAHRSSVAIDCIVLAGAGCRLPIVRESFSQERFPNVSLADKPGQAKRQVAFGLARYLELNQDASEMVEGLSCSSDYTSSAMGLFFAGRGDPKEVVPPCSSVNDANRWYDLGKINLQKRVVRWYRWNHRNPQPQLMGIFDLCSPVADLAELESQLPANSPSPKQSLPADVAQAARAAVRLVGSEDQLQLKVEIAGQIYGYWQLIPEQS